MELIAAIVLAGPLGYFARTRRAGLLLYLLAWAVLFPVQFLVVRSENPDDISWSYWVVNAFILALGLVLNQLGHRRGRARRSRLPALPRVADRRR